MYECFLIFHFKLVIIYYSFCVLADDAISNLAKRPYIRIKSEDRHAAYCYKPGPSLYPENTLTKHRQHYKIFIIYIPHIYVQI